MKTYAEAAGKKPFDWNAALRILYSEMTHDKIDEMAMFAGNWVTCACGNQCEIIPRIWSSAIPKDRLLAILGMRFYDCIHGMQMSFHVANKANFNRFRRSAIVCLAKIEARSAEIIKEMQS